jgi:hypothetical protein
VAGRAAEERLVERGGEVLEVEHEDEGDEGQRERVRRQEGAPPPPVAVLRLPRSHRLGKQAEASSLPPCCYPRTRFFTASLLASQDSHAGDAVEIETG